MWVSFTVMPLDPGGKICIADLGVWCFPLATEVGPFVYCRLARDANKTRSDKTCGFFKGKAKVYIYIPYIQYIPYTYTHQSDITPANGCKQPCMSCGLEPTQFDLIKQAQISKLACIFLRSQLINIKDKMFTCCQMSYFAFWIDKLGGGGKERETDLH